MPWADRHQATFYQAIQRGETYQAQLRGAQVLIVVCLSLLIFMLTICSLGLALIHAARQSM